MIKVKKIFKILRLLILVMLINSGVFVMSVRAGVFKNIQVLLVTTSMTTMSHQYIASIFASDAAISDILKDNRVESTSASSTKSMINLLADKRTNTTNVSDEITDINEDGVTINEKHKTVVEENNTIDLINISGQGYKGHMLIVSDPKRIKIVSTRSLNKLGTKLNDLIKENDGIGGINAGGFADNGGIGNGGTPVGILMENGEIKYQDAISKSYNIIGLDKDGILTLGNFTTGEMKQRDIVDAVSFDPFLVVDGKPTTIYGDGGWGINPRTAIGQRADGAILLLVIDGRQVSSVGVTIKELQNIMIKYGAVNAANLDGGASTVMYYEGKLINKPCSSAGERFLPSAFIVTK